MPLNVDVRVELRRRRRSTCPVCLRRRVLYALDAMGLVPPTADRSYFEAQAVGYGVAMCLECGGLRTPKERQS